MEPSQPAQEQRGADHDRFQKTPLPSILDREMDLRLSQKMRRADAAAAAASARAGGQRRMGRASAKDGHPLHSSPSSSSESEDGWLDATTAADPARGTNSRTDVAESTAPLTLNARRSGGPDAGVRGNVDDGDKVGSRRRVAGVTYTPQATVHPNNPNPRPNKARDGRFSFVPGDDGLLTANSQLAGQSTPRVHEQASRLRYDQDKSGTRLTHLPRPLAPLPPPDDGLTAREQGHQTAGTAAMPARRG